MPSSRRRFRDVPVDASVDVECPRCLGDASCYVTYGIVDSIDCAHGCHTRYSADERAAVEQAATDAAETARHELDFSHLHRCGADGR
jgi:hypothetical protein